MSAMTDNDIKSDCLKVEDGKELLLTLIHDGDGSSEIKSEISLAGEGATCNIYGATVCKDNDSSMIGIDVRHLVPECKSSQSFRTIAAGNSKCSFHGKIIVSPGAQKTEAYQESHSILLSENAKVETLPQLEIYADDVKCSHGREPDFLYAFARDFRKDRP